MKIKTGKSKGRFGKGVEVILTGDEVASAIDTYLTAHSIHINGARTVRINGEPCKKGSIYIDPSANLVAKGIGYDCYTGKKM